MSREPGKTCREWRANAALERARFVLSGRDSTVHSIPL